MKLLLCCVPYDMGRSGISVYIKNVVSELQKQGHELTLLVEEEAQNFFPEYKKIVLPKICNRPIASGLYCLFLLRFRIKKELFDRLIVLAANRRMVSHPALETYAVVHDLSQYHVPVKYDWLRTLYIKMVLSRSAKKHTHAIMAVSRSTAVDITRFWHIPPGKILVNYNGINRSSLPLAENDASQKIVLYVSRIEVPGKNHANLIKAWELLPDALTDEYKLIMPGADWFGAAQIHKMAEESPKKASIEMPGFISQEQLRDYYKHGSLYIFPSFFEGFGLSLIEAMASGMVSACSNNSSLGEIAGDAALTFEPGSPQEIAGAIEKALTDRELRSMLRERGLRREKDFSWEAHARMLTSERKGYGTVFGCNFTTGTMAQTLEQIDEMVAGPQAHPKICAFINADCLNQYYTKPEYAELLAQADLVMPDGIGVEIAAKWQGTPVQDNINGTDMLPLLCRMPHSIYLLGAAPGIAEKARENLKRDFPNVRIVGVDHGYFADAAAEKAAIERVNQAKPDILLVAMGVPRQEKWLFKHREELNCKVAMGVGGLFDFASGRIPRAPKWMLKMKIEWTYRLYNEPIRLFKRYIIGNPVFLWRVLLNGSKDLYGQKRP